MKEFDKTYVTSDLLELLQSMPDNEHVDVILSVKAGCDTKRLANRAEVLWSFFLLYDTFRKRWICHINILQNTIN